MGIYDAPANIEFIKKKAGEDKIFYIGYSEGTVAMFYGLIKKGKKISDSLHKYVALAPCSIGSLGQTKPEDNMFRLQEIGVYALWNTPTWEDDLNNKICKELPEWYCNDMKYYSDLGVQTMSVQDDWYWEFNALQDRFQEYAYDYFKGETQTPLLDLSTITAPPIALFSGSKDVTCPYATALKIKDQIGDAVQKFFTIENEDHMFFASRNDPDFIRNLVSQLTVETHPSLTGEVLRLQ